MKSPSASLAAMVSAAPPARRNTDGAAFLGTVAPTANGVEAVLAARPPTPVSSQGGRADLSNKSAAKDGAAADLRPRPTLSPAAGADQSGQAAWRSAWLLAISGMAGAFEEGLGQDWTAPACAKRAAIALIQAHDMQVGK